MGGLISGLITLYLMRIILTLFPQTGYIHPDEFFQTVEVAADDVLDVKGHHTWEFNSSFPIRSSLSVYLPVGVAFYLLQLIKSQLPNIITPYLVLVVPRLFLTFASFFNDYVLWKVSKSYGFQPKMCAVLFASSYLPLVFYTKPLSNTTETFIFNAVLLFTTSKMKSLPKGDKPVRANQFDDDDDTALLSSVQYDSIIGSSGIGILISLGLFNRPTFLIFSLVPVLIWLWNSLSIFVLIAKGMNLAVGFGVASSAIICIDTLYYNHSLTDLELDVEFCMEKASYLFECIMAAAKDHFIFTPMNFILYNTNPNNLASHGTHPWYLHSTANSTILFGPFWILSLLCLIKAIKQTVKRNRTENIQLLLMVFVPILLFSLFPHQEPRFLIPLLTPVIMIVSPYFQPKSWYVKPLAISWILFNLITTVFFGFVHQGGVIGSLFYFNSKLDVRANNPNQLVLNMNRMWNSNDSVHIVYSGTYMPPEHLLLQPSRKQQDISLLSQNMIQIHDLKGSCPDTVIDYVKDLQTISTSIYVVTPYSRLPELCDSLPFVWTHYIFPHISMENPPDVNGLFRANLTKSNNCIPQNLRYSLWTNLKHQFSLIILKL